MSTISEQQLAAADQSHSDYDEPLVIVSVDTHVGPRLVDDLRPYCEQRYLEQFDEFAARIGPIPTEKEDLIAAYRRIGIGRDLTEAMAWNAQTAGHFDSEARARDLDSDGIAAEVIFHGSQNWVPLPFDPTGFFGNIHAESGNLELLTTGRRMYNRWLADFCSLEPERRAGLAQVPIWDLDAATAEVEWAAEAGLKGINFPAADAPGMPPLDDPAFERFYAACADLEMPLTTHVSAAPPGHRYKRSPYGGPIGLLDAGWWCRRAMVILTLSGAFERHPGLKLVLTEHPGSWLLGTLEEMDSMYHYMQSGPLRAFLPCLPSEYVRRNVWIGTSFQSRPEAVEAIELGISDRLMWGSDYPHVEGTWCYQETDDQERMTHIALSNTYHDLPLEHVRAMVGGNAIECYGRFDGNALRKVAERIGAPTARQILTERPEPAVKPRNFHMSMAFRTRGHWS